MSFSRIGTNAASQQAFTHLQSISSELARHRERLATGRRLNRAEDDPAGYAMANGLEAKTRGQAQALKNIGDAKGMLSVAEGGLDTTMDLLQTMREKAVQAANDTLGRSERAAIQGQLEALTEEIDAVAEGTEFNGRALLDGTAGGDDGLSFQVGAERGDTFEVGLGSARAEDLGLVKPDGKAVSFEAEIDEGDFDFSVRPTVVFGDDHKGPGKTYEIHFGGYRDSGVRGDTSDDAFYLSVDGREGQEIILEGIAIDSEADLADPDGDAALQGDNGQGASAVEDEIVMRFAGVDGADIQAGIANGGSMSVRVTENTSDSLLDVSTSAKAGKTIDTLDAAIAEVSGQVADLGSAQSRLSFKQDHLSTSKTSYEASRSRIEDADFAREQIEISKLQLLQQTGVASLAQANASSQAVLQLMG